MKYRLIVYGLLAICATWVFTAKAQRIQIEETEILIVANPVNPLNPVVKNPYQDEYERMLYPTVRISSPSGTGSGVVISQTQTYILTAAHVVEDESTVEIETTNEHGLTRINASVVMTDTTKDLALLSFSEGISFTARLAPRNYTPYIFTPVYTVGCSLGLQPRPSAGILSVIGKDNWEVTSPILPGNSGGPVYDARTFEVIGIAVWVKVYDQQLVTTMAGIVPINQIHEFLKEHN